MTHVDCDNGVLTVINGQTYQKDFIIAADGVHVNIEAWRHLSGSERQFLKSILTGLVEGTVLSNQSLRNRAIGLLIYDSDAESS